MMFGKAFLLILSMNIGFCCLVGAPSPFMEKNTYTQEIQELRMHATQPDNHSENANTIPYEENGHALARTISLNELRLLKEMSVARF